MRTVFTSADAKLVGRVRDSLDEWAASAAAGRRTATGVEDWAIVGEPAAVRDQIEQYRSALGMTHLIVTRLRIGGVDATHLERSVETVASMFGRHDQ